MSSLTADKVRPRRGVYSNSRGDTGPFGSDCKVVCGPCQVEELLVWLWDTHVLSTQVASHELHLKIIAAVHKGHQQDGSSDSRGAS